MSDTVSFEFYSDTNLNNALDELQLMSLGVMYQSGNILVIGWEDMQAMGDSIEAIVSDNGGATVE